MPPIFALIDCNNFYVFSSVRDVTTMVFKTRVMSMWNFWP
jgi:hypothetical protein